MMKTWLAALVMAASAVLVGCNTIEGAGRDLERGGEKVQDTARDVKRGM
jgi:predicted small secreted protein